MEYRKYEIWHDESKENGYHHGLLFVPLDKRKRIIELLKKIRSKYSIPHDQKIKFAGSIKRQKIGWVVSNNLALFSHITKTNKYNVSTKIYNLSQKNKHKNYQDFLEVMGSFGCHFGLLKIIEDNLKSLCFNTYAKKVETTFNFALRGCCHGMFNIRNPIEIIKFYFDGEKHYNDSINLARIAKGKLRDYIKISNNISIDARQRNERRDDTGIMIDFVDNIIGAFRAKLNNQEDKNHVLHPLSDIYKRLFENKIFSNYNSRWYKSISFSELTVNHKTGCINFPDIFKNPNQKELF